MTLLIDHKETRPQRDSRGRFTKGNAISKRGGQARARRLTPTRRRQIARQGWRGLVAKQFGGDERAAKAWLGALGAFHYDQQVMDAWGAVRPAFPHPGTPTAFRERLYTPSLFDPMLREPDFYTEGRA